MTEFEHHWDEENVKKEFIYNNRPCVVFQHPTIGHYCGYTKTRLPSLSWKNTTYNEGDNCVKLIEVHGGITYGIDKEDWVGFDCGHSKDVCLENGEIANDGVIFTPEEERTNVWTVEDVVEETKYLADQISALEQYLENNFPGFNTY